MTAVVCEVKLEQYVDLLILRAVTNILYVFYRYSVRILGLYSGMVYSCSAE